MRIVKIMLCSLMVFSLHAFKSIEHAKRDIIATLQITNPVILPKFNNFCAQYDQTVTTFFDNNNHAPLTKHLEIMEKNLVSLQQTIENPAYKTVRHILTDLKQHLVNMVSLLTKYTGSKNAIGLGFKIRKFKNLLPSSVAKKGDISLLWSLNHRLGC